MLPTAKKKDFVWSNFFVKDFLISQVLFAKKIMIIALILQELWQVFKNFVSKVANRARWFLMRFLLNWLKKISIFQFRKLKLKTKKSLVRSLNHIILSFQKNFWAQNIIIGAYKIQNVFEQMKRDRARSRFNCAKMFRCYSLE